MHVEQVGSNSPGTLLRPFFRPATTPHKRSVLKEKGKKKEEGAEEEPFLLLVVQ